MNLLANSEETNMLWLLNNKNATNGTKVNASDIYQYKLNINPNICLPNRLLENSITNEKLILQAKQRSNDISINIIKLATLSQHQ